VNVGLRLVDGWDVMGLRDEGEVVGFKEGIFVGVLDGIREATEVVTAAVG